jgi:hypothetical protein
MGPGRTESGHGGLYTRQDLYDEEYQADDDAGIGEDEQEEYNEP